MFSWLSCEKYTESASKLLDQDLPLLERIRFRFHHLICINCRRFYRQINAIDRCCESAHESVPGPNQFGLSEQAKQKLQSSIDTHIDKPKT